MLAQLELTFGNPHGARATTAHRTLSRLTFDIRKDDINEFISIVNTLADKTDFRETVRKATLFNCLPSGFDPTGHLHLETENSEVSYDSFTRVLTAAVLSKNEGYEHRRQKNLATKAKSSPPSRHRSERSERAKTRSAPVFDVKKLIGMTREGARSKGACYDNGLTVHLQAEYPNRRAVIREFTARFKEEDEGDIGYLPFAESFGGNLGR
ncbi:hypothetical protein E4U30_002955 [Claviceps sp. LM220 group G6]|nr:hypothetical protein E4U30_002955 [Claviceps sp. LM220 group G6]